MSHKTYAIKNPSPFRYEFISRGPKGDICKLAEFTPTIIQGFYNFGFGNKLEDGGVDDKVESNNGDLSVVFGTLLEIIEDFCRKHPGIEIFFQGSTPQRTRIYQALLCRYHSTLEKTYTLSGFIEEENIMVQKNFEPGTGQQYFAFSMVKKQ